MDKKYGVYICEGCGIGDAVDIAKLRDVAQEEGFPEVAAAFRMVAKVEVEHEKRYNKLIANIENNEVFKKSSPVRWKCRNCGYVHEGVEAPDLCPTCVHEKKYFEIKETNY